MDKKDTTNYEPRLPIQQAAQPQPASSSPPKNAPNHTEEYGGAVEDKAKVVLDDARETAGLIDLYKELLKAPIPEEMLRLVKELESKERK
jgi:hypothetical protein